MRRSAVIWLTVVLALAAAPTMAGAAARPDKSFGRSGWVTTSLPGSGSVAYGLTVVDGQIVAVGQTSPQLGNGQVLIARYTQDGRLDSSFGSGGTFVPELPSQDGPFLANAVMPLESGGLLVAGGYGQGEMLVMRVTQGGELDTTFGVDGIARVNSGGVAQSMAVQQDGGILLGGANLNTSGRSFVVARLTPDGALDSSFGTGGIATTVFWDPKLAQGSPVSGVATTPDGDITGFGHIDYGYGAAGVFQLSGDGQPQAGFGSDGHAEIKFPERSRRNAMFADWFPCAAGVDPQARITVAGLGEVGSTVGILTARLTPAGSLDPAYGQAGDGRAFTRGGRDDGFLTCGAAVAPNGSLTLGVAAILAQLTPNGSPNRSFAPGGVLTITKPRKVGINALVRVGGHRAVVAGSAGDSLYVARYLLRTPR